MYGAGRDSAPLGQETGGPGLRGSRRPPARRRAFRRTGGSGHPRCMARHPAQDRGCPERWSHRQPAPQTAQPPARGHQHACRHADTHMSGRHRRIGTVQRPGHGECGDDVNDRHGGGHLVPGMTVGLGRRGMAARPAHGVSGTDRPVGGPARSPGEGQMQHALHRQGACRSHHRGEATTSGRPRTGELEQGQRRHDRPRCRHSPGRLMSQSRQHAARQGERPGPSADARGARPPRP